MAEVIIEPGQRDRTGPAARPSPSGDDCPCDVCRASSPDRKGPRVGGGVAAAPGESLVGLVARTSGANWLPRLRAILATTTPASVWQVHYNLAARDDVDFAQLAFACRLAPHEVEERRYRPIELMPALPGVRFHGASIPAYDLELRDRRVAPSWLRAGHHCALGHHRLATHCPDSGELLLDACPRCGTRLTWTRSAFHGCHACGLDISHHEGEVVPRSALLATRPMLDLVHPDPARHAPAAEVLHPLLHELDRGLVFEIGWRLGCVLTGQGLYDRDAAGRLPVETRLAILAAGSGALTEWPNSLTDALRGLGGSGTEPSLAIASDARRVTMFKNAWPELKDALHRAAPGLKGGALRAVKATLEEGVNARELEKTLGVGQKVVDRLRGSELRPVIATGDVNVHGIFEGAGLEQLRSLLGDRIAVGTIAEQMNVSRHGIEQLACLREIEVFDDGAVSAAYRQRQARRSDYERLLERLGEESITIETQEGMPIRHAMKAIGGREKPWGPVIAAMLSGRIAFSLNGGDDKVMDRVRIRSRDLAKLVVLRFDPAAYPGFAFETAINGRDVEELLNIFPKTTRVARKEGSLASSEDGSHSRATILDLAIQRISVSEVLARWNGRDRKLPAPLRGRKGPPRLDALGWDRQTVETEMATAGVSDRGRDAWQARS